MIVSLALTLAAFKFSLAACLSIRGMSSSFGLRTALRLSRDLSDRAVAPR